MSSGGGFRNFSPGTSFERLVHQRHAPRFHVSTDLQAVEVSARGKLAAIHVTASPDDFVVPLARHLIVKENVHEAPRKVINPQGHDSRPLQVKSNICGGIERVGMIAL